MNHRAVLIVIAAALAGCSTVAPGATPTQTPNLPASTSDSVATTGVGSDAPPTELMTPGATTPSPTSTTTPDPDSSSAPTIGVEAHDRFWDPFVDFGPPIGMPYGLKSVADATELSDLVIVGSIRDLYIGEQWIGSADERPEPMAYLSLEIHEVLKGQAISRTEGKVEVQFGFGFSTGDFERISSEPLPEGEYIFFLIHEATFREEGDRPPRDSEIAPFAYFIPNEVQGVVLNANGIAEVVLADRFAGSWGTQRFPMSIRGQSFESVIDDVRSIVAAPPSLAADPSSAAAVPSLSADCPDLEPTFMPADLVEYEVRDNDGIRVKIWGAGSGLDDRKLSVITGWGEVEGVTESGITTTLLGREVEIYDQGEGSYTVVLGWNDPYVSLCQMIVVGSDGLALEEFTRTVESVREVEP